MTYSTLQHQRL